MATAEGGAQGLAPAHRRFIVRDALLIAALVNATLSALIAWLFTLGEDEIPLAAVPLVGGPSVIVDSVGTFFVLPFLTTLAITTVIWSEMRRGHLPRLSLPRGSLAARLPATRLRRAVRIGLLCMFALGPPAALVLVLVDYGDLAVGEFVLYKALFGVVLGALVTPFIALLAFGGEPPAAQGAPS